MADEIKLETTQKSVKIDCVLSFRKADADASFDYKLVIEDGIIKIDPHDSRTRVVAIYPLSGNDVEKSDKKRKIQIAHFDATMLTDDDDFDYFFEVDEFGNGACIIPDSENCSFISVAVDNSLNLATEAHEETVEECVKEPIEECTDPVVEYTTNESVEPEQESDTLTESLDETQKEEIRTRFQQGAISIFQGFGKPDVSLVRMTEFDAKSRDSDSSYEYYYDPESDSMVYYIVKNEDQEQ